MICWHWWKNISIAADLFSYLENSHIGQKSKLLVCFINPALVSEPVEDKGGVNKA